MHLVSRLCLEWFEPKGSSQLRLERRIGRSDTTSDLIELDLLAGDQTLLQRTANLHSVDSALESHRWLGVIQTAGRELVRLGDESVFETAVVMWWDLSSDTARLVDIDQIRDRLCVDGKLALCSCDLGRVFLSSCHHSAAEQLRDLSSVELHNSYSVVSVIVFSQLWADCCDADCAHTLDNRVLTEEPQGKVDVVNAAVDEDAA